MSEPLGLHHVTFIPLPAVDLPFLRILYGVSVADFNIFRNFLKSSLSIMHPPPPPPPPNLMSHSSSVFPVIYSHDSNRNIMRH